MYIEVRKNAFYLKHSQWDKEAKKTKSTSIYLGSDYLKAKNELGKLVTPESPILKELFQAQENYAYNRAIISLKKLWLEIGDTKAGLEVYKLHKKLIKAQEKYDDKLHKNCAYKSQLITNFQAQNNCDNESVVNSDDKSQDKDDDKSHKNCDNKSYENCDYVPKCPSCKTGYLQEKKGKNGLYLGCTKYPNCRYTENYKAQ